MDADDRTIGRADVLAILDRHGVYLSDPDEQEIVDRMVASDDVGDLALRTCMCGARIDGFDAYWNHLYSLATG